MKFIDTTSLNLVFFDEHPPSKYAVLSYDRNEQFDQPHLDPITHLSSAAVSCGLWPRRTGLGLKAFQVVVDACHKAQDREMPYLWAHSMCVDQSSSADVAEYVTRSFRLIWDAALCIAYLPDLMPIANDGASPIISQAAFSICRWFSCSWALQDLIAAPRLELFDRDWNLRCTKTPTSPPAHLEMLSSASGVDLAVLTNRTSLFDVSLGRRISWAAQRRSRPPEDDSYALMGVCGVGGQMIPHYGEGRRQSFYRLQKKILESTTDLSILAWKSQRPDYENEDNNKSDGLGKYNSRKHGQALFSGIFAESAADFSHFSSALTDGKPFSSDAELIFVNRGLRIQAPVILGCHQPGVPREVILILNSSSRSFPVHIGISLREVKPGLFVRLNQDEIVYSSATTKPARIYLRLQSNDRDCSSVGPKLGDFSRVLDWVDEITSYTHNLGMPEDMLQDKTSTAKTNGSTDGTPGYRREAVPTYLNRLPSKRSFAEMLQPEDTSDSGYDYDVLRFELRVRKSERLEHHHRLRPFVSILATLGLDAWAKEKAEAAVYTENKLGKNLVSSKVTSNTISRPVLGSVSLPFHQRKRILRMIESEKARDKDENANYTADSDCEEPDLVVVRPQCDTSIDLLACPFYRFNPERYNSCLWEVELSDLSAARQHVLDDHSLPDYCPVCYAVFNSTSERNIHIIARSCSICPPPPGLLNGVSQDQAERLSCHEEEEGWHATRKDCDANISRDQIEEMDTKQQWWTHSIDKKERWFRMWDILFPGAQRPESPYLSTHLERVAVSLRLFWDRFGPQLMMSVLRKHGLQQYHQVGGEAALAALHASTLEVMIQKSGLAWSAKENNMI